MQPMASNDPAKLTPRVSRLLEAHGITTAEQVRARYPLDLLGIRGFGYKALREVEAIILLQQEPYWPQPGEQPNRCQCRLCRR